MIIATVILHVRRMIANQRKYNLQKLSTDVHHSLNLWHAPVKHSQIIFMHDPVGPNGINSNKKQQVAKIGASSLGDVALPRCFPELKLPSA